MNSTIFVTARCPDEGCSVRHGVPTHMRNRAKISHVCQDCGHGSKHLGDDQDEPDFVIEVWEPFNKEDHNLVFKNAIKDAGHTQRELSKQLGISESWISHIIRRDKEPTSKTACMFAGALGIPVADLGFRIKEVS